MISRFFSNLFRDASARRARNGEYDWDLSPDDRCVVNVTEQTVVCSRPDGARESVSWPALTRVEIEAGDGLWGRNVRWVLHDDAHSCHVPHGSVGEMSLMASLQSLPDWDNGAIMAALRTTGNFRYECWSREYGWQRRHWHREQAA